VVRNASVAPVAVVVLVVTAMAVTVAVKKGRRAVPPVNSLLLSVVDSAVAAVLLLPLRRFATKMGLSDEPFSCGGVSHSSKVCSLLNG
jgi:hypothetical protein